MFQKKGRSFIRVSIIQSIIILTFSGILVATDTKEIDSDIFKSLRYRHIGPPGNRVSAVSGVPGDPKTYYAGAATGGIFKTEDGGINWTPVFDDQIVLCIGALAVAPSDPNIVWAGTGETFFRNNNKYLPIGNGIYKSSDAGKNWSHAGLEKTGRIGRIVIDPRNPDIVFAAALGHCFGPQEERGVFRSVDGGENWKRVLFVDKDTGCSDIAMDPNNPSVLFAGMWQTLGEQSGGPGSGLYVSKDGGNTWKRLKGHGLPDPPLGKIGIAVAPSDSNRVYALIETGGGLPRLGKEKTSCGVLWVSNDGGENWQLVSYDLNLAGRAAYYTRCAVSPEDCNEVYFIAARLSVSIDGGQTVKSIGRELHGDHHDMWIDPTEGDRLIESNDGGVGISVNRGKTWQQINLPIAQLYHVSVDNQIPYYVYGNLQDGPSHRGPSNSRLGRGGIPRGMWHGVGGSESGFALPDPVDNNIIWSTGHPGGALDRYDVKTGQTRAVDVWPDQIWGWPDVDLRYRFQRTYPIAISPHDHNKVYIGSQFVHQTTDEGNSWTIISPDLTTNDKSRQQTQAGLTPMDSGTEDCVIFAIAESPCEEGLIWVGTNDGLVQVTRDGGSHWTNVTPNIPNLPLWGTVSNVEPSRYDSGTCYITVNLHEENIRDPYVYKTSDYGMHWKSISSNLPRSVTYSCNARCIKEDPVRKGFLYLGTENAVYISFDDGTRWFPLQNNLPHAPAHWLAVQEHFNDLVVGTYGRGFWILDDISPLQQFNPEILESDVHLFSPRPAYRFNRITPPVTQQGDPCIGENPPYGASINYYLKSPSEGQVKIEILDESGRNIRTLKGTNEAGFNRVWWDLRCERTKEIRLRTPPLQAPWIEMSDKGWRPLPVRGGGQIAILMPPGDYSVKLTAGGKEFSRKFTLKKDPHSSGSIEDIQVQTKLLFEIRENIASVAGMINQLEWIRKQTSDLGSLLREVKDAEDLMISVKEFDQKVVSIEENLVQLRATGRGQDSYRGPSKLIRKLLYFFRSVNSSDFPPTAQQMERHESFKTELETYQSQFLGLMEKDLPAFNSVMAARNISRIVAVKIP